MGNESLEQRARELLNLHADPIPVAVEDGSWFMVREQDALDAIKAALESTPAQEVELPEPASPACEAGVDGMREWDAHPNYYTADQLRAYGQACASARTAPAVTAEMKADLYKLEGCRMAIGGTREFAEMYQEGCRDFILKYGAALLQSTAPAEGGATLRHPHTGELRDYRDVNSDPEGKLCVGPGPLKSATTAPVVGDELASLYAAAAKGFHITESCGPDAKYWHVSKFRSMQDLHDFHAAWMAAMVSLRNTARPAKADDPLLVKLQALVEEWRTRYGITDAYKLCADELENTYHTARTVKAEGDALCTHARGAPAEDHYRCSDCGAVKTDSGWGIAKHRWFRNLDEALFYKTNGTLPDTARTVSRGDA